MQITKAMEGRKVYFKHPDFPFLIVGRAGHSFWSGGFVRYRGERFSEDLVNREETMSLWREEKYKDEPEDDDDSGIGPMPFLIAAGM